MSEKGFLKEMSRLKNRFNKLKQQIENEEIHFYIAKDKAKILYDESIRLKTYLSHMGASQCTLEKLYFLIHQIRELFCDLVDIVEIERNSIRSVYD